MHTKKKIDNFTIHLDNMLGEGSYGKVYEGEQETTGLKVAVKMLDKKMGSSLNIQSKRMTTSKKHFSSKSKSSAPSRAKI